MEVEIYQTGNETGGRDQFVLRDPPPASAPSVAFTYACEAPALRSGSGTYPVWYAEYENGHAVWWLYGSDEPDRPVLTMACAMPRHDDLDRLHHDLEAGLTVVAMRELERHGQRHYRCLGFGNFAEDDVCETLSTRGGASREGCLVVC